MKKNRNWIRSPLAKLILTIVILLALSSVLFYYIELRGQENRGFLEALWWSVVTISTVGYGDIVPLSTAGRILGVIVMLSGIGLVSTLTGNLASLLVEQHTKKRKGLLKVKLSEHVIIVGWNPYGFNLVNSLEKTAAQQAQPVVLVNTLPPDQRDEIKHKLDLGDNVYFVSGNPGNEAVAARTSPDKARVIYILCPEDLSPAEADQQNIYTALTLHSLAPKVPMYAEVMLCENREHLLRAGVNEVIARGELSGNILGLMGTTPAFFPFFKQLTGSDTQGLLQCRSLSKEEKKLDWKTFLATVRQHNGALPLALFKKSNQLTLQDILDQESALDHFILELFSSAGQSTQLGKQQPQVTINPPDNQSLGGFDAVMFLQAGEAHDH
jgi:voltage-gated potassium channel